RGSRVLVLLEGLAEEAAADGRRCRGGDGVRLLEGLAEETAAGGRRCRGGDGVRLLEGLAEETAATGRRDVARRDVARQLADFGPHHYATRPDARDGPDLLGLLGRHPHDRGAELGPAGRWRTRMDRHAACVSGS